MCPGLGHLLAYVLVMDYPSSSISGTCCVLDTLDQQGFPPHSGEVQWEIIRPHVGEIPVLGGSEFYLGECAYLHEWCYGPISSGQTLLGRTHTPILYV